MVRYHSKNVHKWPNKDHPLYSIKYLKTNKINLILNHHHHGKTHKWTPLLLIVLPSLTNITLKLNKISLIIILSISSKTLMYPISSHVMILTSMIKLIKSPLIKSLNDLYQLIIFTFNLLFLTFLFTKYIEFLKFLNSKKLYSLDSIQN